VRDDYQDLYCNLLAKKGRFGPASIERLEAFKTGHEG